MSTEPDRQLFCPECEAPLDILEVMHGRGVTGDGVWVTKSGDMHTEIDSTVGLDDDTTVGAVCSQCDWKIERPDWFEYLKEYEANEIARIKEEFEAVKRGEDPPTRAPSASSWPVDLVPGHIKVIIPVKDGEPIEMTLDMTQMDGPADIHVDPDKRTVSFESDEPLREVTEGFDYPNEYELHSTKISTEIDDEIDDDKVFIVSFHEDDYQGIKGPFTESEAREKINKLRAEGLNPDTVWDGDNCMNEYGDGWMLERAK